MTHKFLWGALVAASAVLLPGVPRAIAQNTADQQSEHSNVDSPHQTPAGTTHDEQQINLPESQLGEQARSENDNRSWSNERQPRDSRDQTYEGEPRRDARESRENRRGDDWRSEIRFGEPTQGGLAIVNVERGTAFYQGGLHQGDVIISYDGRPIRSEDDFRRWAVYRPGQRVPVIVLRDGRRETVYITYDQDRSYLDRNYSEGQASNEPEAFLGVRFEPRMRASTVIASVMPGSPAERAGLQTGDEIVAINGREVRSAREATRAVASMQPGDRVDIEFSRRMNEKTQAVLEARPDESHTAQNGRTEVQVFRGGPEYDRMAEPESDQPTNSASGNYGNSGQTQRDLNRRGGGLLPRLRN